MALTAVLQQPFDEQVAFFRAKLGNLIPTETWTDVWKSAHDTGFMVAGAAKADLLADLAAAVDSAIRWLRRGDCGVNDQGNGLAEGQSQRSEAERC